MSDCEACGSAKVPDQRGFELCVPCTWKRLNAAEAENAILRGVVYDVRGWRKSCFRSYYTWCSVANHVAELDAILARAGTVTNAVGCRPSEDVCLEHDEPLECPHGCSEARAHQCASTKTEER